MSKQNFAIDLVFLWVDGNDPVWAEKKAKTTGAVTEVNPENDAKARYSNNDELKYALRSVTQFAPWIRKIFIVTDNQTPDWLITSDPKITVVDHQEIIPNNALPCFNSSVIEYFLYKIPDLAEHFLFANDDMFINKPVNPDFFFEENGLPIVRLKKHPFGKWEAILKKLIGKKPGQYAQMVADATEKVAIKFGKYYKGVPHHNIDAYLKTDYKAAVEKVFNEEIAKSQIHHVRTFGDMHRSAFSYYALAIGRAKLKYVQRTESSRILVFKHNFKQYIEKYNPVLFCLNDNQNSTDEHRKNIKPFLESVFPNKSSFEK